MVMRRVVLLGLAGVLVVLIAADLALTLRALEVGGVEANPLFAGLNEGQAGLAVGASVLTAGLVLASAVAAAPWRGVAVGYGAALVVLIGLRVAVLAHNAQVLQVLVGGG